MSLVECIEAVEDINDLTEISTVPKLWFVFLQILERLRIQSPLLDCGNIGSAS